MNELVFVPDAWDTETEHCFSILVEFSQINALLTHSFLPPPVQDMADSRRINSNIREEESRLSEEEQPPLSLSSIILSSEFWPPLKEEKLELPPLVCQAMEAYTHRYEKLKVELTCCLAPICWFCLEGTVAPGRACFRFFGLELRSLFSQLLKLSFFF